MEWNAFIPVIRSRRFWSISATTLGAGVVLVGALYGLACAAKELADWTKAKDAPLSDYATQFSAWYESLRWETWAMAGLVALVVCNALVAGYRVRKAEERAQKEIDSMRESIPDQVTLGVQEAFDKIQVKSAFGPEMMFGGGAKNSAEVAALRAENEQLRAVRADKERLQSARKLCVGAARELEVALADVSNRSLVASWSYRFPRFITEAFSVDSDAPAEILDAFSKAHQSDARKALMVLVGIAHDAASRLQPDSLAPDFDPGEGDWQSWAPAKELPYRASGSLRESSDRFAVKVLETAALAAKSRGPAEGAVAPEARLDALHGMCDKLAEFCDGEIARVRASGSDDLKPANEFCETVVDMLRSTLTPRALHTEHAAFDRAVDVAFCALPPQPVAALLASRKWVVTFRDRVDDSHLRVNFLPLNLPESVVNKQPPT